MAITTLNLRALNRSDTASADQVWKATIKATKEKYPKPD